MLKAPRHIVMVLIGAATAASGCITEPDALRMQVTPTRPVISYNERAQLQITLTSHGGPVCYGKESEFVVELTRDDEKEPLRSSRHAYCGTALLPWLPLYPVLIPAAFLDVADVAGRFVVIPEGREKKYLVELGLGERSLVAWPQEEASSTDTALSLKPLPPGHYRARVEFMEEHGLAPLFWAPYDKPVVAETEFRIEAENEAAPR